MRGVYLQPLTSDLHTDSGSLVVTLVCVSQQKLLLFFSSSPLKMDHRTKEAEPTAVSDLCLGVMEEAASHTINPPPPPLLLLTLTLIQLFFSF